MYLFDEDQYGGATGSLPQVFGPDYRGFSDPDKEEALRMMQRLAGGGLNPAGFKSYLGGIPSLMPSIGPTPPPDQPSPAGLVFAKPAPLDRPVQIGDGAISDIFGAMPGMAGGRLARQMPAPPMASPPDKPFYSQEDFNTIIAPFKTPMGPTIDNSGSSPAWAGNYQASPFRALDNFIPQEPQHILGYSGTGGTTTPVVDYSGPALRNQIIRQNTAIADMLSNNDRANADSYVKNMLGMASIGNKSQQSIDRALALTSNAKVSTEAADAEIDNLVKQGVLEPSKGAAMKLEKRLSVPNAQGQLVPLLPEKGTGSLYNMLNRIPEDTPPAVAAKFLQENRGITRDQVVKRYQQLLESGMPLVDPENIWGGKNTNPDTFNKGKLTPEQRSEFDLITKIFGRK